MSIKYSCDICERNIPDVQEIRQWDRKRPFTTGYIDASSKGFPKDVCESCDTDIKLFIFNLKEEYIKEENS